MINPIQFRILPGLFGIYKMAPDSPIDASLLKDEFVWIGRTDDELSIVTRAENVKTAECIAVEENWACLKVTTSMDFDVVGIIAEISRVLAEGKIPIFCISTYNTDYILVDQIHLERTVKLLSQAGHSISHV